MNRLTITHHGAAGDAPIALVTFATDAEGNATGDALDLQELAPGVTTVLIVRPGTVTGIVQGDAQ